MVRLLFQQPKPRGLPRSCQICEKKFQPYGPQNFQCPTCYDKKYNKQRRKYSGKR